MPEVVVSFARTAFIDDLLSGTCTEAVFLVLSYQHSGLALIE